MSNPATSALITPQNIVNITIQYKPASNVPSGKVNFTSIFVTFNDGVDRYQQIGLNEMLTYIQMLEIQAALAGKFVVAFQSSPDVEQWTSITVGNNPDVPPPSGNVTFTQNGSPFTIVQQLTNQVNTSGAADNVRAFSASPFLVTFLLPQFTGLFDNDYSLVSSATSDTAWYDNGDGNYFVVYIGQPVASGNITVDIVNLNVVQINSVADGTGYSSDVLFRRDSDTTGILIPAFGTKYLVRDNSGYDLGGLGNSSFGAITARQFVNNVQVKEDYALPVHSFISPFSNNVDRIDLIAVQIQFKGQTPSGVGRNFIGNQDTQSGFAFIDNTTGLIRNIPFTKSDAGGNIAVDSDYNGINFLISFLKKGTSVSNDTINSIYQFVNTVDPNYDTIVFGAVGTVGSPVTVRNAGVEAGICALGSITLYTNDGTISAGKTLYDDVILSTPHLGDSFISDVSTGIIYSVNPATGVVGAATGNTCVPSTAKNVFVINSSGVAITITSSQGSFNFNAGVNGNMLVLPDDNLINDSATARTFKFLQSLPSTLDPDVPAPNPRTIAGGGTSIIVLTNNITNLNYIIVT